MEWIKDEFLELLANIIFIVVLSGLTFFALTFFIEFLCSIILLYLFRPLIKKL
jgi:predicted PurR-regulated permease PerM